MGHWDHRVIVLDLRLLLKHNLQYATFNFISHVSYLDPEAGTRGFSSTYISKWSNMDHDSGTASQYSKYFQKYIYIIVLFGCNWRNLVARHQIHPPDGAFIGLAHSGCCRLSNFRQKDNTTLIFCCFSHHTAFISKIFASICGFLLNRQHSFMISMATC